MRFNSDHKSEIDEILKKLDIGAYMDREGIEYKPTSGSRGPQYNLEVCPCCGNDKWKVFLNQESGLGNCFHGDCEKKFNKFTFIRHHTGLAGKDLMEHIRSVGAEIGWRPARKSVIAVTTDVRNLKIPNSFDIPINGRNLAYLENRGITVDIAKYFHLRFCKKGLFVYEVEGMKRFMPFDMRVIIPVFDLDGTLVSFQGRDITGEAEKKYLFPPGFASTGEHLYNGHNVHNTERIVVGEGVFDIMAQKIALDQDPDLRDVVPVGTFGKHLSEGQLWKLLVLKERGVKEITFMWDGELKATDDAIASGIAAKGLGFKVRIAMLPKGKDPNEVSTEVVRAAFWGARELTMTNATKIAMMRRME